jgi:hypothetical protein
MVRRGPARARPVCSQPVAAIRLAAQLESQRHGSEQLQREIVECRDRAALQFERDLTDPLDRPAAGGTNPAAVDGGLDANTGSRGKIGDEPRHLGLEQRIEPVGDIRRQETTAVGCLRVGVLAGNRIFPFAAREQRFAG